MKPEIVKVTHNGTPVPFELDEEGRVRFPGGLRVENGDVLKAHYSDEAEVTAELPKR